MVGVDVSGSLLEHQPFADGELQGLRTDLDTCYCVACTSGYVGGGVV